MPRLPEIATPVFCRGALLLTFLLGATITASAQIGPDKYGYKAAAIAFNFEDITANNLPSIPILDNTDDSAVTIPIGFSFTIYGVTYTTVSVSTNGILTFGGADTTPDPIDFKTAAPPSNLKTIAPFWSDWTFQFFGSDEAYYFTTGTTGSRHLIVQWNFAQSHPSTSRDTVTFQVKLFEGSNNMEFHYNDATITGDTRYSNGNNATVGIRDVNGQTTGRNLEWSFNQVAINDGSAIRYTAPVFAVKTITRQSNSIVLQCIGAPSQPNWVEATTSLTTAFARLGSSVTADINGNFQFTDSSPGTRKFYRVGFP